MRLPSRQRIAIRAMPTNRAAAIVSISSTWIISEETEPLEARPITECSPKPLAFALNMACVSALHTAAGRAFGMVRNSKPGAAAAPSSRPTQYTSTSRHELCPEIAAARVTAGVMDPAGTRWKRATARATAAPQDSRRRPTAGLTVIPGYSTTPNPMKITRSVPRNSAAKRVNKPAGAGASSAVPASSRTGSVVICAGADMQISHRTAGDNEAILSEEAERLLRIGTDPNGDYLDVE